MTAEARELIDGQYADRPHLRPVLDAVLAALPGLGPVTVQARTTLVSLVTPRRTFAVVQATTKNRVDLGLRLDDMPPGGRLLAARDIGAATVRIGLSAPGDLDEEALGWLRRAYEENTAPAPPRRPARRPAPKVGQLTVVIEGFDLPGLTCRPEPGGPGHHQVHVALTGPRKDRRGPAGPGEDGPTLVVPGRPGLAWRPVPGDAPSARWEVTVTVRRDQDGFDFCGPFVRGDRADRHLGLAWGDAPGDGTLRFVPRRQTPARRRRTPARRGGHAPRSPAPRPGPADRRPGQPGLCPPPPARHHLVGQAGLAAAAGRASGGGGAG